MRLDADNARGLPADVATPSYRREEQRVGIVHLGHGAFARAHQAVYADDAMEGGNRDWAVAGVSLRSNGVRDALEPQDGLYSVVESGSAGRRTRVVGSVREVLVAPEHADRVVALLSSPSVHVVTLTVTEKAYHARPDGTLDVDAVRNAGDSIYHRLARGLSARRDRRLPGLTIVSCDNLAGNGAVIAGGLSSWLDRDDPPLRRWFERECACPTTMVDRIVPAVTASDLDRVEASIGVRDEGAVVTEPFRQWVIEDRFAGPSRGGSWAARPSWTTWRPTRRPSCAC